MINAEENSCEVKVSTMLYIYSILTYETDYEYELELAITLYKYFKARPLAGLRISGKEGLKNGTETGIQKA